MDDQTFNVSNATEPVVIVDPSHHDGGKHFDQSLNITNGHNYLPETLNPYNPPMCYLPL